MSAERINLAELERVAKAAQASLAQVAHSRKINGDAAITIGASKVLRLIAALRILPLSWLIEHGITDEGAKE